MAIPLKQEMPDHAAYPRNPPTRPHLGMESREDQIYRARHHKEPTEEPPPRNNMRIRMIKFESRDLREAVTEIRERRGPRGGRTDTSRAGAQACRRAGGRFRARGDARHVRAAEVKDGNHGWATVMPAATKVGRGGGWEARAGRRVRYREGGSGDL